MTVGSLIGLERIFRDYKAAYPTHGGLDFFDAVDPFLRGDEVIVTSSFLVTRVDLVMKTALQCFAGSRISEGKLYPGAALFGGRRVQIHVPTFYSLGSKENPAIIVGEEGIDLRAGDCQLTYTLLYLSEEAPLILPLCAKMNHVSVIRFKRGSEDFYKASSWDTTEQFLSDHDGVIGWLGDELLAISR